MADKYVVWSPAKGGWNKYHIAKASELSNSSAVLLRPLCRTNKGATVSAWWLQLKGTVPLFEARPLEDKEHQCDKCQVKWWSLRKQEGYPTEGIFSED